MEDKYQMKISFAFYMVAAATIVAAAEEKAPIVKVGLYKNGLAAVTRRVTPDAKGVATVDGSARPAYGTFWHSAEKPVTVTRGVPEGNATLTFRAPPEFRQVLEAAIIAPDMKLAAFSSGEKDILLSANGTLLAKGGFADTDDGWDDPFQRRSFGVQQGWKLRLKNGSTLTVPRHCLVAVAGTSAADAEWRFSGSDKPFDVEYLTSGASWTPSYRLELAEGGKGRLFMSAELRNELGDWKDAEVSLISGFPNLKYASVPSLLGKDVGFDMYRRAVEAAESPDRSTGIGAMTQVMLNSASFDGMNTDPAAYAAAEAGAGADIHYRPIGKITLGKDQTVSLPLGAETADVKRMVDWDLDDRRDGWGRLVNQDKQPELWDAVKIRNPFGFPLTTAPMEVVEDGRILGQSPCSWTNPGDEVVVKVTKALSVKGAFEERGDGKGISSKVSSFDVGERFRFQGYDYRKETVTATFNVTNFRKEPVEMHVKKTISGEIVESAFQPTAVRNPPPEDNRVNPVRELTWEFELKAGESREFEFTYWLWVRM